MLVLCPSFLRIRERLGYIKKHHECVKLNQIKINLSIEMKVFLVFIFSAIVASTIKNRIKMLT